MGKNISISLCVITKNEEDNLACCLESVCDYVDEIIVVDTGSTDKTLEIAQDYGADVYRHIWKDDFSEARNESISRAKGEWILYLDADEELPQETAKSLKKLSSVNSVEAWTFNIISPVKNQKKSPASLHINLRMFKNKACYKFEGRVHEQIKPSILKNNCENVIKHSDKNINHYGYIQNTKNKEKKSRRNIYLLKKELEEKKDDYFVNFNLGTSYYNLKKYKKAGKYYQKALNNSNPNKKITGDIYRNYTVCLLDMGEYLKADKLLDKALLNFNDYPDLYYLKGQIAYELYNYNEAEKYFLRCLQFPDISFDYTMTKGVNGILALESLSEVYRSKGELKKSVNYLVSALKEDYDYQLLLQLAKILKKTNYSGKEIVNYLEDNFNLKRTTVAKIIYDISQYDPCINYCDDCCKDSWNYKLILYKVDSLMQKKNHLEAKNILLELSQDFLYKKEIVRRICLCSWLLSEKNFVKEFLNNFKNKLKPLDFSEIALYQIVNDYLLGIYPEDKSDNDFKKNEKSRNELEELIVKIVIYNDRDLALDILNLFNLDTQERREKYYQLVKLLYKKNKYQAASNIITDLSVNNKFSDTSKSILLAGKVFSKLNKHRLAFNYFLKYIKSDLENKVVKTMAFHELVKGCLENIVLYVDLSCQNTYDTMIELKSLLKKLSWKLEVADSERRDFSLYDSQK